MAGEDAIPPFYFVLYIITTGSARVFPMLPKPSVCSLNWEQGNAVLAQKEEPVPEAYPLTQVEYLHVLGDLQITFYKNAYHRLSSYDNRSF
jgi:hypothetical protein